MSDDKEPRRFTFKLGFDWFWICIAAMVIAMMHYGYSCTGCASCEAPKSVQPTEPQQLPRTVAAEGAVACACVCSRSGSHTPGPTDSAGDSDA